MTPPKYGSKVDAVVLHDQSSLTLDSSGRLTTLSRRAIRILTRAGRLQATGHQIYLTGSGRVKGFQAWLMRPSGDVRKYGKDEVLDAALVNNDVYNEVRMRVVSASEDAEPGAVFGYEVAAEDTPVFLQAEWTFQERLPVLLSRYSVNVPPFWRVEGLTYNHPRLTPLVAGTSYTWEIRDLPPLEPEDAGPPVSALAPRLAVNFVPPPGAPRGPGRYFQTWADVALWLSELADPQIAPDRALVDKALSLTSSAKTDWDKIDAIGRFAQRVQYVSIQTGLGRGGGYKPRPATQVLARNYGDCKDKANFMRALLKIVGIEAYPVVIYSGDPTRVQKDWPSPQQFNHCILGARVKEEIGAAAVGAHPKLGRILFFDPTDEHTPLGSLPDHEEGSLALLVSANSGELLLMPSSAPGDNRVERRLDLAVSSDGTVSGAVRETAFGHSAVSARRKQRSLSRTDYQAQTERWISYSGSGATLKRLDAGDGPSGSFQMEAEFEIPRYARSMQGRLLVLPTAVLRVRGGPELHEPSRKYPVILTAESFEEITFVQLPSGFDVDEIPRPYQLQTDYGAFDSSCSGAAGKLECRRRLSVKASTVPVNEYAKLREFFDRVRGSERLPVVLARR